MHEMSIAQNILEIVQETLAKEDSVQLKEVVLDIGELVAIVPDSLEFCYNVLTEQTPYQGSKLTINIIPLKGKCKTCAHIFSIEKMCFLCPRCKSTELDIIQGQELKISHLEVI
jgi:hydrogenase nickel incorporation protein HypA/HybF